MVNFKFSVLAICLLVYVCNAYDNCKDWRQHNPNIGSGEYLVGNGKGQNHKVYCEFYNGHGYMFLPKDVSVSVNMKLLNPLRSEVLVRYRRTDNLQFETTLSQINAYAKKYPLSLQYNANKDYKTPHNARRLGPYMYLGFLPESVAASKTVQGYQVNGKDYKFKNCDANGNSYMAFFFDLKDGTPRGYYKKCCYNDFMNQWISKGKPTTHTLSSEYFFQTEMHMGGCGGYALSGYMSQSKIAGSALGMKFYM